MQRVIITTGGTGGHIFPALAVARELRRRFPEIRILFVGGRRGPEERMAREAGLEFVSLPVAGVLGRGVRAVGAAAGIAWAVCRSLALMARFRPQVVVGFGGYAGFAPVLAGWLWTAPTALQEQNSVPGMANRLLGKVVRRVCVAFEGTERYFPSGKCVVTGNPVRDEIVGVAGAPLPGKRHLLVLGGSQGARGLNRAVAAAAKHLTAAGVTIRHQAGPALVDETRALYRENGLDDGGVTAFIDDMAETYRWADLVLCRAGAATVAELAAAGRPAVFIPFPHATHDHQTANARYLEQAGAAKVVQESQLQTVKLGPLLASLLKDEDVLRSMARASASAGKPEAAAAVADEIETLARRVKPGVRTHIQAAL